MIIHIDTTDAAGRVMINGVTGILTEYDQRLIRSGASGYRLNMKFVVDHSVDFYTRDMPSLLKKNLISHKLHSITKPK